MLVRDSEGRDKIQAWGNLSYVGGSFVVRQLLKDPGT